MDASTPVRERVVRVGPLVNLPALVDELGHDPKPIFEKAGIDLESYAEVRQLYRAWRRGRLRAGTPMAAALEGRRAVLRELDLGVYEPLDS